MKQLLFLGVVTFCMTVGAAAEQLKTDISKAANGETVTKIGYAKEPNGLILKVFYGDSPKYRLLSVYYDGTNPDHFEHSDYNDFDASDSSAPPKMSWSVDYYRSDDPDERLTRTMQKVNEVLTAVVKYRSGNKKNISESVIEYKDGKNASMQQDTYADSAKAIGKISVLRVYYDDSGNEVMEMAKYATNEKFLNEEIRKYQPPVFSRENGKPIRTVKTYTSHPMGLLKTETEYDNMGGSTSLDFYNWKLTKDGYSRQLRTYSGNSLMRQLVYFDDKLLDGKVLLVVSTLNQDSTYTTKYFDKTGQEVDLSVTSKQ